MDFCLPFGGVRILGAGDVEERGERMADGHAEDDDHGMDECRCPGVERPESPRLRVRRGARVRRGHLAATAAHPPG